MSRNGHVENGKAPRADASLADAVGKRPKSDLFDLYNFWCGNGATRMPRDPVEVRRAVLERMSDSALVEERVGDLGRRLGSVFERLVRAPGHRCTYTELVDSRELSYLSTYDMEACLTALQRRALVVEEAGARFAEVGLRMYAVPSELVDALLRQRRKAERGTFDVITLRGHLDQMYADPERARRITPQRLREMYKMYARETAAESRIERLPDGVRDLVHKAILEFGGILPRGLFERMDTELPHWNGRRWRMILEQSLVGTVQELDLSRYGIRHGDETLVVFNEVALAWLRRVAVPSDPDRPHEELSLGIDLISNLSRFLGFLLENDVRFTVKGEIFKTTEKKIIQYLIPNPGRELSREEVLEFIYRFCRHEGLIDCTGERTLAVTAAGYDWEQRPLAHKLKALHEFAIEEKTLEGEPFHQTRMRRILVRLLKRVEPDTWYDLMYLPFLARNTYLASLDDLGVEDWFAERSNGAQYAPMDDAQRMAWNLARWVRQRMYLLGIVDLGYDKAQRPVAMRLTRSGARLLGVHDCPAPATGGVGNLVVTPDFEVVLFRSGDDAELVHDLDRFCVRDKLGQLLHFRITEDSVRRSLAQGMRLEHILATLESHSRTPVPQNVSFSIRDWAKSAGLMALGEDLVIRCDDPETLRRFQRDPGVRSYVKSVIDERRIQLGGRITRRRLQALLRELGHLVELA